MTFKKKLLTDAYFNQITFHWLCPTQNIKWLMVDSWQCHWVEAKLKCLELQRAPCHILVHRSTIRGWHMHCAPCTVPVNSALQCALCTSALKYDQGVTYALQGLKSGSQIAPTLKCPTMPSWPAAAPMKKLELCSWRLVHNDQRRRELVTEVVVFIIATLISLSQQRLYYSTIVATGGRVKFAPAV